ncbi:hypothetical protein GURKE_03730 [Brevundimonas phage vB_BpoS-Gurke]|uniref:Uncharacterized protein n=1 Tax=Brevundimonas phage vB_BpoS-Gurke TaxID=2948599 RepID=A0A9E7N3Z8_9CAUD|nr:hypothetical protein GURKE_03730 [Brevundimonas phage vB_BpoS-Gurke]
MTDVLFHEEWGIPYYWIEDGQLVQRLNGVTRVGAFVDGRFVAEEGGTDD